MDLGAPVYIYGASRYTLTTPAPPCSARYALSAYPAGLEGRGRVCIVGYADARHPFDTGDLLLSHGGVPGVNGVSHRGGRPAAWERRLAPLSEALDASPGTQTTLFR